MKWVINGEPWYWSPWVVLPLIATWGGCFLTVAIVGLISEIKGAFKQ